MKKTLLSQKRNRRFPWRGKRPRYFNLTHTESYMCSHPDVFGRWIGLISGDEQSPLGENSSIMEGNWRVQEGCRVVNEKIVELITTLPPSPSQIREALEQKSPLAEQWKGLETIDAVHYVYGREVDDSDIERLTPQMDQFGVRREFIVDDIVRRRNRDRTKANRRYEITGYYCKVIGGHDA